MQNLVIKRIENIYHTNTEHWSREYFAPRYASGIVFVIKGENEYRFRNKFLVAKKNDILILPAKESYSGVSFSGGLFEGIVIDFICDERETIDYLGLPRVISVSDKKYFRTLFEELLNVWRKRYADVDLQAKALLYKLIYKLYREVNDVYDEKTPQIIEYINDNLSNKKLSVSHLCDIFYISESTMNRNLKKVTGYSPNAYISMQRLERAREYVMNGELSIKDISLRCGYSSPYYFSNAFKKRYGCSPSKYKIDNSLF